VVRPEDGHQPAAVRHQPAADRHQPAADHHQPAAHARPPCPRQQRWDRIGLGIRLAYNPWHTPAIRCYLDVGGQLVQAGVRGKREVQERMLTVLLQAASDPGLPWRWRSACHEHTVWPLARLATRWRLGERSIDVAQWQARVDTVGQALLRALPGDDGRS
jgi:hypothetical protein